MINCAIYPRKSKAVDNSTSMDAQIYQCKEYLDRKYGKGNYTLAIYDKDYGVTGHSTRKRKDFQRMMADIADKKIQLVLIQRYDRIARNTRDFCNLYHDMEQVGCNIVSVSQQIDTSTPYGKNFMYQMAAMAELEWALTSERYKDMHKYKIAHGYAYTGKLPRFGFKIETINGVKKIVHDREEETRAIFGHLILTKNKVGTAKWVRQNYDPDFTLRMLQSMINSDLYLGRVRNNENFCQPYFDQEYIDKVRSLNCVKHTPSGISYLFTGLIRCPLCNKKLAGNKNTKRGKTYIYYRCPSGIIGAHQHYAIGEELIEKSLLDNIGFYMDAYEAKISPTSANERAKKTKDIEEINEAMKRLDHLYEMGRLDIDSYDRKITALQKQMDDLSKEIVEKKIVAKEYLFDNWKDMYFGLNQKNKMMFWQNILREVEVNPEKEVNGVIFL